MFGVESVQLESSALGRVSQLLGHILCLPNLPPNGIRYEGSRENRQECSRNSVSVGGIDTPKRRSTPRGRVSSVYQPLRIIYCWIEQPIFRNGNSILEDTLLTTACAKVENILSRALTDLRELLDSVKRER